VGFVATDGRLSQLQGQQFAGGGSGNQIEQLRGGLPGAILDLAQYPIAGMMPRMPPPSVDSTLITLGILILPPTSLSVARQYEAD
jgi:hypothetical protein